MPVTSDKYKEAETTLPDELKPVFDPVRSHGKARSASWT